MLQHKFEIENADGTTETRTSTLCEYGAPTGSGGYSAMAKLVGVPCAVGESLPDTRFLESFLHATFADTACQTAVKQVLNGTISEKGILAPLNSKINDPLIKELKEKYG